MRLLTVSTVLVTVLIALQVVNFQRGIRQSILDRELVQPEIVYIPKVIDIFLAP